MFKTVLASCAIFIAIFLFSVQQKNLALISPANGWILEQKAPEENRFSKIVLVEKLDEPLKLAVLNDGRVLFIELKGKLKMYDPATKLTKVVNTLNVYSLNEDGLLGLAADPNFDTNHFIYLYYSPAGIESINRLSRFVFENNKLDLASEKIIITIPVFRSCCHSGGSIAFGPDGNIFLSLGDDTGATKYSPIDERTRTGVEPGGSDSQRSAGNTNDLRGKILRIHPELDGTYTIPKGNLFPKGTPNTKPEIYVMGTRNPFRISVDQKTGFLYWGEVGPDAGEDSISRGPKGYDEVNQARKSGFFGWPYFVADNKAYWDYDFKTEKSSALFDANAPINDSPHNTGLKNLPPAQKAFIWYPYSASKEFPLVGEGGRMAMAGPVFYDDMYAPSDIKFPKYYNGKLFIYEWMRDWIMAVTMDPNGNYIRMERFMPGTVFNKPVDMQFAKDGSLYVLEYGNYWHSQNDDARLSRIEFSEKNRNPIVKASSDKKEGAIPFTIAFSSKGTFDYDKGDKLTYEWTFDTPGIVQSREANPTFIFKKPGVFKPVLKVKDAAGKQVSAQLQVLVGNEPPKIAIEITSNRSFYWDNSTLNYRVKVLDKEDGSTEKGTILPKQAIVTFSYIQQVSETAEPALGHQSVAASNEIKGKMLINKSDCKACHAIDQKSVGPSFAEISKRYKNNPDMVDKLALKVIKGGSGNWGDIQMSAHPQVSKADATEMVTYILALSEIKKPDPMVIVPLKGNLALTQHQGKGEEGIYKLMASYKDKGGNKIGSLTSQEEVILRNPKVIAVDGDEIKGAGKAYSGIFQVIKFTEDKAYVLFKNIDLTQVNQLIYSLDPVNTSGKLELHMDKLDGQLLGTTDVVSQSNKPANNKSGRWFDVKATIEPISGVHNIYIVFRNATSISIWNAFLLNTIYFNSEKKK